MRSVLVTGAAGFIGSHLCEALLAAGYAVTGIDNFDPFYNRQVKEANLEAISRHPHFHFAEGDAGDGTLLNALPRPIDIVVHLAAKPGVLPSIRNPAAYINNNIGVTNNLLEWMRQKGLNKLVFASSSSVYGNNTKIPFSESDDVNEPISPYAFTKRSCELMNYTYHSLYGFGIINLRFFTVYGERQRPDLAIHKFVRQVLEQKPITIYGDGRTARDYTYYSDTVKGVMAAVARVDSADAIWETYNLGNNSPVYLIDLVKTIGRLARTEPVLVYEDMKPGDVNITYADISLAGKALNYKPAVPLEQGIGNFIEWFKQRKGLS